MTDWPSKQRELLSPAEQVIDAGIDYWATNKTETDRIDQLSEIEKNESEYRELYYETEFGELIEEHTKEKDLEQFAGARLMIASADYKDRGSSSILVGDKDTVSQQAAEQVLDIEKYSQFLRLDDDSLKDHILDHDDHIYALVKGYIASQEKTLKTIRGPETDLDDDFQVAFLNDRIETIRGNLKNAAIILIREGRLSEVVDNIE
jgi:hypothetical protein